MIRSRRHLLALAPALAASAALAACTTTTSNGVTTVTLDTARIVDDGGAIIAAITSALAAQSLRLIMGDKVPLAQEALAGAQTALDQIKALTGGSVSAKLDTTTVRAEVTSLLGDAQTALGLVQGALTTMPGKLVADIQNYVSAALTLIPFVQLAAGFAGARERSTTGMSEAMALRVARSR